MHRESQTVLTDVVDDMARAGSALVQLGACEGAAGNLSVYLKESPALPADLTESEDYRFPVEVPELQGACFIVTGSGTRMRDIASRPWSCLGVLSVGRDGKSGRLHFSRARAFSRITSEFNSHLAVHRGTVTKSHASFHAIVHAQPKKLTYLSHLDRYQDSAVMTQRLLRWQPEGILNFPEGISVIPFLLPGQRELMLENERALSSQRLAVWAKHGVMARSATSVQAAVDLIEYAESAAEYEYLNEVAGGAAVGLSQAEIARVADAYGVVQKLF